MKVLTGYLTQTNKKHIQAILNNCLLQGTINDITYYLETKDKKEYKVIIFKKDKGLIPVQGSKLRISKYTSTFKL